MTVASGIIPLEDLDRVQLDYERLSRDARQAREVRTGLLRASYALHLRTNPGYAEYVRRCADTDPGAAAEPEVIDPADVPLLPSGLFKLPDLDLLSVAARDVTKWCVSSGTSGSRSVVPRDEETLARFLGSITASLPPLYDLERAGGLRALVLGPGAHEAGDLWFSYVIGCLCVFMQTEVFETGGVFDVGAAADRLVDVTDDGGDVLVIGPPARMAQLARTAAGRVRLSPGSFLVTAGGWKGDAARSIEPGPFRELLRTALDVPGESQIRDSYNMVELNSVLHECAHRRKHVPPWLLAQARDPRTDAPLPDGTFGVLAFWDPTATSYPCFVLSEDFGVVDPAPCRCGFTTPSVTVVRRVNTLESRGCALKMAGGAPTSDDVGPDRFFALAERRGSA